ncbi:hypothetical protein P170DRAFT_343599, partial [Aspergillus steynii IBT 23096]
NIFIDFIIYLFKSQNYNIILIIINRLTKIKYLISYNLTINIPAVAIIYI